MLTYVNKTKIVLSVFYCRHRAVGLCNWRYFKESNVVTWRV